MATSLVRAEAIGSVFVVVLDNPPLNVLNRAMHQDLVAVCRDIAADDSIRAVVFTGEGDRGFSAGAEIKKTLPEAPPVPDELRHALALECATFDRVAELPQPTVAAIFGYTLGGGLELSVSCDFRIAASTLKAGLPEAKWGYFPASGGLVRVAQLIGYPVTKRMAMLGEFVGADDALAIGLVDEVVEPGALRDRAMEFGRALASPDSAAVRAVKQILDADQARFHAQDVELILDVATAMARSHHVAASQEHSG